MFCPKCAAHNIDDAKYCRVCGADISLIPQVLSGELAISLATTDEADAAETAPPVKRKRKEKDKTPTLDKAYENIGVGIAFLIITIMVALFMPGGRFWWFWLLIPTGACVGEGIGQLLRIKREKALGSDYQGPQLRAPRSAPVSALPPRNTSEMMMPPPSITEGTTRHLSPEPRAGNLDEPVERPQSMFDSKVK